MSESNLKTVSRIANRTAGGRRTAAKGYTVSRYRLRLIKEDEEPVSEPESLTRPAEVAAFLWQRIFDGLDREVVCGVYTNSRCRVIGWTVAYVGCLTRCSVEPRGLVVPALLANAAGLIIAHNHPAGSELPSSEDRLFTLRMHHVCDMLGLKLLESMVIAEGRTGPRWSSVLPVVNE